MQPISFPPYKDHVMRTYKLYMHDAWQNCALCCIVHKTIHTDFWTSCLVQVRAYIYA